jgi:hypothetical protein
MSLQTNIAFVFLGFLVISMASKTNEKLSFKTLSGNWTNELGSTCQFIAAEDGAVTGYYNTAVGKAHVQHPLSGQWLQGRKNPDIVLVSFIVMWKDTDEDKPRSATTWNGQLFADENNDPKFVTTWILVSEKEPAEMWKSTLINKDTFRKNIA